MEIRVEDPKDLAIIVAQLVREGVGFRVEYSVRAHAWVIELTGGF